MSDTDEDMLRTQNRSLERENRQLRRNLRDEFAMAALPAVVGNLTVAGLDSPDPIAGCCYAIADAMLEARKS